MLHMVLLKRDNGSQTATVACPSCGWISSEELKNAFADASFCVLHTPHQCPVCGTVYHACSTVQASDWASAFAQYCDAPRAYAESVKASYRAGNSERSVQEAVKPQDTSTARLMRKVDHWKKELLDTSKRNRMINYRDMKRSTLRILKPDAEALFNDLALGEKTLTFQRPVSKDSDFRTYAMLSLLETLNYPLPILRGDIEAEGTIVEREKTLKNMRSKAKLAQEEQGANILYLSFGFIIWREHNRASSTWLKSPLLLMPVSLGLKSLNAPFTLSRYADEIEVNPTLDYLFKTEYGIELPEFELKNDPASFGKYMAAIEELADKRGWKLVREVSLGLLSFLKISMYHDLDNNLPRILSNPVLRAISGERSALGELPTAACDLDFDNSSPQDWHEVVDSDSSQQEAILLSRQGVSFVMQGPPGTGKSQTITNIIAEALANGKKVLFVSEKAAALQVVLKRLTEVGLDDFCLPLHNNKANKKEIIDQIGANLKLQPEYAGQSVLAEFTELFHDRKYLDEYAKELHEPIEPLGDSVYIVFGKLGKLETASAVDFTLDHPTQLSKAQYASLLYHVSAFEQALHNMEGPLSGNPWHDTTANTSGQVFKAELIAKTEGMQEKLTALNASVASFNDTYHTRIDSTWAGLKTGLEQIGEVLAQRSFPYAWWEKERLSGVLSCARKEKAECAQYHAQLTQNRLTFTDEIINAPLDAWRRTLQHADSVLAELGLVSSTNPYTDALRRSGVVSSALHELKQLAQQYDAANKAVGYVASDSFASARVVCRAISILKKSPVQMKGSWFLAEENAQAARYVQKAMRHAAALSEACGEIEHTWDQAIYEMDADTLRFHFNRDNEWMYARESDKNLKENIRETSAAALSAVLVIESVLASYTKACEILSLEPQFTLQHISMIATIMRIIGNAGSMETGWFDIRKHEELISVCNEAMEHRFRIEKLRAKVLEEWAVDAFKLDARALLDRFKTEYTGLFYKMKSAYKEDMKTVRLLSKRVGRSIDESVAIAFLQTLMEISTERDWFTENEAKLMPVFGALYNGAETDCSKAKEGIGVAREILLLFPYANIPGETICAIQKMTADAQTAGIARQLADELSDDRMSMLVGDLSSFPCLGEVNSESDLLHTILPNVSRVADECGAQLQFAEDLEGHCMEASFTYKDIHQLLDNLAVIGGENEWFSKHSACLEQLLGAAYIGAGSQWDEIASSIACAGELSALFEGNVPRMLIESACTLTALNAETLPCDLLSEEVLSRMEGQLAEILPQEDVAQESLSVKLIPLLTAYDQEIKALKALDAQCREYLVSDGFTAEEYAEKLAGASALRAMQETLRQREAQLTDFFGDRYAGADTDWNGIVTDLEAIERLQETRTEVVSEAFVRTLCEESCARAEAETAHAALTAEFAELNEAVSYFGSLFRYNLLDGVGLSDLGKQYEACLNDFGALNKWLDYAETKADCDALGLSAFTQAIAAQDNRIADVRDAFEKGFYTQWLTLALNDVPSVMTFRRRVHEQRLEKFAALDKKQFTFSQRRIREKIIGSFPDDNQLTRAGSELGILKHEMEKKRQYIPLRQLFRNIPRLLQTLKPCLMMSPLSVAYFLDADAYQFDLVIFDEASQIFPQDAIGAIFRAKQVVIAGDTNQLPPTNFFSASTNNAVTVYDDEEEEGDENELCDSILEETATVLPNRTLLWHYRSRHEHLIAFSNQLIYRNELITFPSSNECEPDTGVEFVYVEEGFYERGGRNYNIPEAKRCVELVKDHFDRHPERSLGIIAFSEKQQQAIAQEVQRFRERNPQYEAFFAEDREDEFFVKNLENVQGDERDTIFFSIGYAKTKEQKKNGKSMLLNFGPLSRLGGERRLNVAITRAKINVKLVGSILPSDIDLSRTESEGIKMLRAYIEFAKNGEAALASSQRVLRNDGFVDAIYRYLTEHGYHAKRYVGCSGYKIDLAIEYPDLPNQFVAGIECDGFSYVAAKTARDRDRLRGSVLSKMGWNMYRVWSAEWFKNPELEGDRLTAFIDKMLAECGERLRAAEQLRRQAEEERRRKEEAERAAREREERKKQLEEERQLEAARKRAAQEKQDRLQEQARLEQERVARETARREKLAREQAKEQSGLDLSWVKVGVMVEHKTMGSGVISRIRDQYVTVKFKADEKTFSSPFCFEQGYLVRETVSQLSDELLAAGFQCIDHRETSSILWVLYSADQKKRFESILAKYNVQCSLERRGALATNNRPAWRIMH